MLQVGGGVMSQLELTAGCEFRPFGLVDQRTKDAIRSEIESRRRMAFRCSAHQEDRKSLLQPSNEFHLRHPRFRWFRARRVLTPARQYFRLRTSGRLIGHKY